MKAEIKIPNETIGALADALDCSIYSVLRYLQSNNRILTTEAACEVFARYGLKWDNGKAVKSAKVIPG